MFVNLSLLVFGLYGEVSMHEECLRAPQENPAIVSERCAFVFECMMHHKPEAIPQNPNAKP